jgi:hypothetical protein
MGKKLTHIHMHWRGEGPEPEGGNGFRTKKTCKIASNPREWNEWSIDVWRAQKPLDLASIL